MGPLKRSLVLGLVLGHVRKPVWICRHLSP